MFNSLKKFAGYLFSKKDEFKDLSYKDALLGKTVLDIHRKRTHSEFKMVPLFALRQIHPIDRDNTIDKTEKRREILLNAKNELLEKRELSRDILNEYLPSVSGIKVVKEIDNSYIAYEGNGRLIALQKVFTPSDNISVEVEEYFFNNPGKIIRRMNRIRKLHGFI